MNVYLMNESLHGLKPEKMNVNMNEIQKRLTSMLNRSCHAGMSLLI